MSAFVFPGQGSQAKGMGNDLFKLFNQNVLIADNILGYSIEDLCIHDRLNQLNNTEYTQPALYTVCSLMYLQKIKEKGEFPDVVAGHSVGEFSALFAANVFDFETGLKIVQYRGKQMSEAKGGGMAAIIGLGIQDVKMILEKNLFVNIDIANHNSHKQIVISGLNDDIQKAIPIFEQSGASMCMPLKVSGAFHSRYMKDASIQFRKFIDQFEFSEPRIQVIANVDGKPYTKANTKENLQRQMFNPVLWLDSITGIMNRGINQFDEIGPGKVLTGIIQRIQRGS